MAIAFQPSLFAAEPVGFEPGTTLTQTLLANGAWCAYQPGWLTGDLDVFETLRDTTAWQDRKSVV